MLKDVLHYIKTHTIERIGNKKTEKEKSCIVENAVSAVLSFLKFYE